MIEMKELYAKNAEIFSSNYYVQQSPIIHITGLPIWWEFPELSVPTAKFKS